METSVQMCFQTLAEDLAANLKEVIKATHDEMKQWIRKELQEQLAFHSRRCNRLSKERPSKTAYSTLRPITESIESRGSCVGMDVKYRMSCLTLNSEESVVSVKPLKTQKAASAFTKYHDRAANTGPKKEWQYKLQKLLDSYCWRVGFLIVLTINSVLVGADIQSFCTHDPDSWRSTVALLDVFVCFLCTMQLSLRIVAQGVGFFVTHAWAPNAFETLCVVLHQIDVFRVLIHGQCIMYWSSIRVFRMIIYAVRGKLGRYVSSLRTLTTSVMSTCKWFFFTSVLLLVVVYVTALYIRNSVAVHMLSEHQHDSEDLHTYYSTLFSTMLSLFQCITGGMDWRDALDPLTSQLGPVMALPFLLYIAFAMMGLLNVITGVFVESALKNTKKDQEIMLIKNTRQLFEDAEGGYTRELSYDMLTAELERPAMKEYFKAIDVDPSEAQNVWCLIDTDRSGTITADEFLDRSLSFSGPARSLDIAMLKQNTHALARCLDKVLYLLEPKAEKMDQRGAESGALLGVTACGYREMRGTTAGKEEVVEGTIKDRKNSNVPFSVWSCNFKRFDTKCRTGLDKTSTKRMSALTSREPVEDKE